MEDSLPTTTDSPPSAGLDIDAFGLLSPYDDSGLDNLLLDYDPPGPQSIGTDLPGDNGALTSLSTPASAPLPDKRQGDTPNATEPGEPDVADPGPTKIGNRFTSGAIKILRTWFNAHERHPYPTPAEIQRLQRQSGLERQQITNWFANTRRRRKFASTLSPSPHLPDSADSGPGTTGAQQPVEIPPRPPTPMAFDIMNPLERWEHSPPEHEAALVSDISRAIAASAGLSGPSTRARSRSAGWSSGNASSVSSAPTSRSSRGSQSSAYSFGSKRSSGSVDSKKHYPSRRRRRQVPKPPHRGRIAFVHERNTYQCTFCTETFKKKYDWQRHEKSLHLSLETWICSPNGSTTANAQGNTVCVYCDKVDPDKPHLDGHHQAACIDRPLEERTFYRKDHLKQHLKLVHETTAMTPSTEGWRTVMDAIRSRCGFCDATFETWTDRGNHLAEHFRDGLTILDWEGDWGFDPSVADMLDNAMPPYLVQFEHGSIIPFKPSRGPADTLPSAYELLKLELEYYLRNHFEANESLPSDDDLKYEGCSVIFGSEFALAADAAAAPTAAMPPVSWLRDLFMSCGDAATRARFRPMGQLVQGRITTLRINGKANIFENCELEAQLCHYYAGGGGASLSDSDIQQAACAVLKRVDSSSPNPSQRFVGFLARLVWESTDWLVALRQRAEQMLHGGVGPGTLMGFDESPASGVREELGLLDFYGSMSADQRRWYFSGMKSGPAPEDNSLAFYPGAAEVNGTPQTELFQPPEQELPDPRDFFLRLHNPRALHAGPHPSPAGGGLPRGHGISFSLNDSHRYLRLAGELSRFVASTMSPNNPASHVPSDDELRHQARWILYDDDDPWNQTPADTEQWLRKFKQDVGLL
ncbi:C2H2 type zinc finger domain-containing protein [Colletotrichum musicola]|uniref:C2H2 type zinc finger domain-containing protein n=1 Tax=Colletotrichum musicola TaxID=2175873 RepID=A0A8H6KEZ6_9PEZI|nr:C2H2 type zinc finger domain-containing protein [Colletotrichum musicola]